MPRQLTGVEIGFLGTVDRPAGAGAYRARQISAYYDSREAEMEAAEAQRASRYIGLAAVWLSERCDRIGRRMLTAR
jgi:hypothetical protein